jgi:hypothetical protein
MSFTVPSVNQDGPKKKSRAIAGCVLEKGKWRHGKAKRKAKTAVNSSYIQPTMSHKSSNAENNA